MFDLASIHAAHSKVKSGADFPRYVQDLIDLGVMAYDTFVNDGRAVYLGKNAYEISSEGKYAKKEIAATAKPEQFKQCLKLHQQGGSDYPTFCQQAAECGVFKWRVDLLESTCTYFDTQGAVIIREVIGV